jgi:hypothetical protein
MACPFPDCSKVYKHKFSLKEHLGKLRNNGYDDKHPSADDLWKTSDVLLLLQTNPFLSVGHSKTEAERIQRTKDCRARYYAKTKEARQLKRKAIFLTNNSTSTQFFSPES